MENTKFQILIAEDDTWAGKAIEDYLKDKYKSWKIYSVKNGKAALSVLKKNKINILLSDIVMEPINGIELAKEVKRKYPNIKIIIQSSQIRLEHIKHLATLRVSVINRINGETSDLETALKYEMEDKKFVSANILEHISRIQELSVNNKIEVSPTEKEIIILLSEGCLKKNIPEKIKTSSRTFERTKANLLKLFNVNTDAQLIAKAKDLNII